MMSTLPMSNTATLLVSKTTTVSLRLIGRSRSETKNFIRLRALRSTWTSSPLHVGDAQQFRTYRKSGGFHGLKINPDPDFIFLIQQAHHAAARAKIFRVTDGENRPPAQRRHDLFDPIALRLADEEDMDRFHITQSSQSLHD